MLRTITPVTGNPPSAPAATFAAPCPMSSRSRSVRGPPRSLSTETADSRLSRPAISAMVSAAPAKPAQPPSGSRGTRCSAGSPAGRSTRGRLMPVATDRPVASATAASGAGTRRTAFGSRGQASRTPRVTTPMSTAWSWCVAICPGRASTLASAEPCAEPPRTTCSWPSTRVAPMPASRPCTIAGETASAARARRVRRKRIWSRPAATVIAQVTGQPWVAIVSASTTVRAADGPLTCSGDPPKRLATSPPTTAEIRPESSGAPAAKATPRDRGTATRKTTIDARTSCFRFSSWRRFFGDGGPVSCSPRTISIMDAGSPKPREKSATQAFLAFVPVRTGSVSRIFQANSAREPPPIAWCRPRTGPQRDDEEPSGLGVRVVTPDVLNSRLSRHGKHRAGDRGQVVVSRNVGRHRVDEVPERPQPDALPGDDVGGDRHVDGAAELHHADAAEDPDVHHRTEVARRRQAVQQAFLEPADVVAPRAAGQEPQRGVRHRRRERVAHERRPVGEDRQRAAGDARRDLRRAQRRRHAQVAAGQRLAEAQHVRRHARVLGGEERARAAEAGRDLVEDQQDVVRL